MALKFYGQFDPSVDKVIYERYFSNKLNGISIECGAFDGLTENCTKFFEDTFKWKTINIEPLNHIYDKLISNRPNSINLNVALSNKNDIQIIRNYSHPVLDYNWGNASIKHSIEHRKYLENISNNTYQEQPIQTITYSKLIEELKISNLDLFILDVEGHELEVLEGMIGCDVLPDVFVIEHGHKSVGFCDEALSKLNVKYKIDYVSFVNSFYVKI
jgi:FkbM family methyltransferase